jgi:hypothetical protein
LNKLSPSYRAFADAPYKSTKRTNYFEIYDLIFSRYQGQKITVLEVGVLNGGGLFMLRNLLGPNARIIGVDLNPACKVFEKYGFEIEILNQSDTEGWNQLFGKIGLVDIILEDGGHTNLQQISTLVSCIKYIRDGGVYLSEDTHTSYWREFGNPSKRSFIEFMKICIDKINSRGPRIKDSEPAELRRVYSIQFFESVVCLFIDGTKSMPSERIANSGKSLAHLDYRNLDKSFRSKLAESQSQLNQNKSGLKKSIHYRIVNVLLGLIYRFENLSLRKYF